MTADDQQTEARILGNLPPLRINMARGLPERRRISKRWFSSLILAAITSLYLMGGALYAALDGREQLTLPAQAYENAAKENKHVVAKGDRPTIQVTPANTDNNIMMVSTITHDGDQNIIKMRPFMHVKVPLAIIPKEKFEFPAFNALNVYSENGKKKKAVSNEPADTIYGAAVESEVAIKLYDFDPNSVRVFSSSGRSTADIEELVRAQAEDLDEGATNIASLSYIDPGRFGEGNSLFVTSPDLTIRPENVSVVNKDYESGERWFEEEVKTARKEQPFTTFLEAQKIEKREAKKIANVLETNLANSQTHIGDKYRLAYQITRKNDETVDRKIIRVSVYRGTSHMVSVARSDDDRLAYSPTPSPLIQIDQQEKKAPKLASGDLPSAYNGIYRAAMSQGLPKEIAGQLIRIMAFDVDFKAKITPEDELSVFLSLEDGKEKATENSEILFASIRLNKKTKSYYRFRDPKSGKVGYFNEEGKSSKKFLLRKPVPNARFKSPFGYRIHPISRIRKLHTGCDWAAPRGTPILAAGDGVIEKAGWAGGYGKQTVIRHANGYESTYSHQSRFKRGIKPGVRVRQGQIIGYIGTTGYSTGPHLHFEVKVNDRFVNPMRIRLPSGDSLKGNNLEKFQTERKRIDHLLNGEAKNKQVASN